MKKFIAFVLSPLAVLAADYSGVTRAKFPDADVVTVENLENVS
jgi:hypothetical protein